MKNKFDVSVVLNMHREAVYLRPTLFSLDACAAAAARAGISVELVAIFDRADQDTLDVFHQTPLKHFSQVKTAEIDVGSLGLARNAGVQLAEGEYIWTADGDDLVSDNSIIQLMHTVNTHENKKVAVFIDFLVAFGDQYHTVRYFDSGYLTAADFTFQHPFVSRIFSQRVAFEEQPYQDLKLSTGFAYEDWDFNCQLYAKGYEFLVAPDTVFFYRQRANSLLKQANATSARLIPHSPLFEPAQFCAAMDKFRKQHPDWSAFLLKRESLHRRNFAQEFWQLETMRQHVFDAARLDPEVQPHLIVSASSYCPVPWGNKHWGFELESFYKMAGTTDFTDVVLLPWLKPGGAEKYILQILEELKSQGISKKILIISGQSASKHEWVTKLPTDSVFIDLYNSFPALSNEDRCGLLVRAMLAISSKGARLHLKASEFAHEVMGRYGAALRNWMQPTYYRFCDDVIVYDLVRLPGASSTKYLRQQLPHITSLVSDCMHIVSVDTNVIGSSAAKHHVIYAQCDVVEAQVLQLAVPRHRLLWSSRICSQKRPDLLLLIGKALEKRLPHVKIDIFGHCEAPYSPAMVETAAISYKGTYNSFTELKTNNYDGFLYTSEFDGLPNVILEALGSGLPVIAPDVGGISEAVKQNQTGFLLENHTDTQILVESYVKSIENLYTQWTESLTMGQNAKNLIASRHSQTAHSASVAKAFSNQNR